MKRLCAYVLVFLMLSGYVAPEMTAQAAVPLTQCFRVVQKSTDLVLAVKDYAMDDWSTMNVIEREEEYGQLWYLLGRDGGKYSLINMGSFKALDVQRASTADKEPLIQWTATAASQNQQVTLNENADGTYSLSFAHSGMYMDTVGTDVCQSLYSGDESQRWIFEPVDISYQSSKASFDTLSLGSSNTGMIVTEFDMCALRDKIDGCVSYTSENNTLGAWSNAAVVIRMYTNGYFSYIDGAAYYDSSVSYSAKEMYHIKLIIDTEGQTYSAYVTPSGGTEFKTICENAAFRSGSLLMSDVGKMCVRGGSGAAADEFVVFNHKLHKAGGAEYLGASKINDSNNISLLPLGGENMMLVMANIGADGEITSAVAKNIDTEGSAMKKMTISFDNDRQAQSHKLYLWDAQTLSPLGDTQSLGTISEDFFKSDHSGELEHLSWAATPPMGWNSWDCFGASVTEDEVRQNADYMAQKLKDFGWEYVIVDIQWFEPTATSDRYNAGAALEMDEWGRLIPAVNRFPSAADGVGFRPLADYVHSLGLKFGIHILRGIPRQAVDKNLPVKGTNLHAQDIADTSSVCSWNSDMYGINPKAEGAAEYYNSIFEMYADWNIDFVKVDDISRPYHKEETELIRNAIDRTGRKIVLSLSPGAAPLSGAQHLNEHANMWRMADDFWDTWNQLYQTFGLCRNWQDLRVEGAWPDGDMLPLGRIGIRSAGGDRKTRFTSDEQRTLMALWCMFRSPLFFGGHLPLNDEETLALITNEALISINQHSSDNHELYHSADGAVVWGARDEENVYIAQFNTSEAELTISTPLEIMNISGGAAVEVFDKTTLALTDTLSSVVPSHGVRLWKISTK